MVDGFNTLDFNNTRLLVTGQTVGYTPAGRTSLDDGATQRGEPRRYTVLDAGRFAGTTDIVVNAKTDVHTNECVLDEVTGLMWSRRESQSVGSASDGLLLWDDTAGNDEDIFEFCDQANLAAVAGFSDWHAPNVFELGSLGLITAAFPDPKLDATAWPSVPLSSHWSSTTRANNTTHALMIDFVSGIVAAAAKNTGAYYCFMVRHGRA